MLIFSEIFSTTATEFLGTTGSYEGVIHLRFETLCTDFQHEEGSPLTGTAVLAGDLLGQVFTVNPSLVLLTESTVPGVVVEGSIVKGFFDTAASTGAGILAASASFETFDADPLTFSFTSMSGFFNLSPFSLDSNTALVGSIDGQVTLFDATSSVTFTEAVERAFSILRDGPCGTTTSL